MIVYAKNTGFHVSELEQRVGKGWQLKIRNI